MRGDKTFKNQIACDYKVPTKVYDVERKHLIGCFDSQLSAADFLGVKPGVVRYAQKSKKRIYKNKLGIIACIR